MSSLIRLLALIVLLIFSVLLSQQAPTPADPGWDDTTALERSPSIRAEAEWYWRQMQTTDW